MRRHNRSNGHGQSTFTTKATKEPKWVDVGNGMIQLKGTNTHLALRGKKWKSVSDKVVKMALPPPSELQVIV